MTNSRRAQRWADIYRVVKDNPGINKPLAARLIGVEPRTMDGLLCGMDNAGYMLAEDDKGRLWVMDESLR